MSDNTENKIKELADEIAVLLEKGLNYFEVVPDTHQTSIRYDSFCALDAAKDRAKKLLALLEAESTCGTCGGSSKVKSGIEVDGVGIVDVEGPCPACRPAEPEGAGEFVKVCKEKANRWCCHFLKDRGDCEHFIGLPEKLDETTTDEYGCPKGWCFYCWSQYQRKVLQAEAEKWKKVAKWAYRELMLHDMSNWAWPKQILGDELFASSLSVENRGLKEENESYLRNIKLRIKHNEKLQAENAGLKDKLACASGTLSDIKGLVTSCVPKDASEDFVRVCKAVLGNILSSKHTKHSRPSFYVHKWEEEIYEQILGDKLLAEITEKKDE